jgi:hypothetical protein
MPKIYCMYCGDEINPNNPNDVKEVVVMDRVINREVVRVCPKRPSGTCHPYDSPERLSYKCMFCGTLAGDIKSLTNGLCEKNPHGEYHIPK